MQATNMFRTLAALLAVAGCGKGVSLGGHDAAPEDSDAAPRCGTITDVPADLTADGTLVGAEPNFLIGACGGAGGESVWRYELASRRGLVIRTDLDDTDVDTVVYFRSADCVDGSTELGCNDDAATGVQQSRLVLPDVAPGTYYVVVDSYASGSAGHLSLAIEEYVPVGAPCEASGSPCVPGYVCRADVGCALPECRDGGDDDADGDIDYPDDAGCDDPDDDGEAIAMSEPVPACGNALDDDGDGLVDYPDDPGCAAASDGREMDLCGPDGEVWPLDDAGATGNTSDGSLVAGASCALATQAREDIYMYRAARSFVRLSFRIDGAPNIDATISLRAAACAGGDEIDCTFMPQIDDIGAPFHRVEAQDVAAGDVLYLIVDGNYRQLTYSYSIEVSGTLAAGASCDPSVPRFECTTGTVCSNTTSTCEAP